MLTSALACVLLALGTRGDVQPLALLASALARELSWEVSLLTHAAHAEWLIEPLRRYGVHLALIDTQPCAVWRGERDGAWRDREPLLRTACAAFVTSCSAAGLPALLVYSLFSLEGAALAERLRVPSHCVSAYPLPRSCAPPRAALRLLAAAHPQLAASRSCWTAVEEWQWALCGDSWAVR